MDRTNSKRHRGTEAQRRKGTKALTVLLLLLAVIGCDRTTGSERPPGYHALQVTLTTGDSVTAWVKVASAEDDQATGLMYRRSLAADCGMLFAYPRPRQLTFWMKNTLMPLSIAFIRSDRTISEIVDMQPDDGRPDYLLPRYSSRDAVQYAMEMPQGWFVQKKIGSGSRLTFSPALQKELE